VLGRFLISINKVEGLGRLATEDDRDGGVGSNGDGGVGGNGAERDVRPGMISSMSSSLLLEMEGYYRWWACQSGNING
jgi:hypothetical protein